METAQEFLQQCHVDGNIIRVPRETVDRKVYSEAKKRLELIGGTWKSKEWGFLFKSDPSGLLAELQGGGVRNIKQEFQYFPTPKDLAEIMVEYLDVKDEHAILEPSAGQGALVKAVLRRHRPRQGVFIYELMPENVMIMNNDPELDEVSFVAQDFMKTDPPCLFDRIIANPPFTKNQDIDHIRRMWDLLKPGGIIVTLASTHWRLSTSKKEIEFKKWLEKNEAMIHEIPAGTFKESGTNISCVLIILDKPKSSLKAV